MSSKIQIKRGTTAQWASSSNDTTLAPGQPGVEYRTSGSPRLKVGLNTTSDWSEIPYVAPDSDVYRDSSIQFKSHNTSISCSTNTETSPSQALEFKVYGQGLTPKIEMNLTDGYASSFIYFLLDSFYTPQPTVSLGTSIFPWQTTYTKAVKGITNGLYWDNIDTPFLSRDSDENYITLSNSSSVLQLHTSGGMIFRVSNAAHWILSPTGTSSTTLRPVGTAYLGQYSGTLSDEPTGYQALEGGLQDIILTSNASLTFNVNSSSRPVMRELISVASSNQTGGGFASAPMGTLSVGNYYLSELQLNAYSSISMDANDINLSGGVGPINISGRGINITATNTSSSDAYIDLLTQPNSPAGGRLRIIKDAIFPFRSTSMSCGTSNYRWSTVYANNGTIQTSDRAAKSDIHYIEDTKQSQVMLMSAQVTQSEENVNITTTDLLNLVKTLMPAVFAYKNSDGTETLISDAIANNNTEAVQLGLIADDIKDNQLFNYIGSTMEYEEEVTPAIFDSEGNITTPAVTETKTTLGLKAVPLAVLALTACKNLLQRVEQLENKQN